MDTDWPDAFILTASQNFLFYSFHIKILCERFKKLNAINHKCRMYLSRENEWI